MGGVCKGEGRGAKGRGGGGGEREVEGRREQLPHEKTSEKREPREVECAHMWSL